MNRIALHCSSFVAMRCGFNPPHSWEECVRALAEYYRPAETFAERFDQLIHHVQALGFDTLDVWQPGQLNWLWASGEHISAARSLLERHHMTVSSLAGEFGRTQAEFLAACRLAKAIQAPILSGMCDLLYSDRPFVIRTLKENDLKLALENHPEVTAQEMLDKLGDGGDGRIGTAIDTGWYATRGFDVVQAIQELDRHILHVHLKDVLPGEGHINCGYGKGCVPLADCVQALKKIGYTGIFSIENHNLDHDPDQELIEGRKLVQEWLAQPD